MSASRDPIIPFAKQLVVNEDGSFQQEWYRFLNSLNTQVASATPTGVVSDYAGTAANVPDGWLLCDGSAVSRTLYTTLFGVIAEIYGNGNGSTTFNLPDVAGKITIGVNGTYALASTGGAADTTLVIANLPSHTHTPTDPQHTHTATDAGHVHGVTDGGHVHAAGTGNFATDFAGSGLYATGAVFGDAQANTASATTGLSINSGTAVVTNTASSTGITIGNTGSDTSFSRLPPYIAFNKIIKT